MGGGRWAVGGRGERWAVGGGRNRQERPCSAEVALVAYRSSDWYGASRQGRKSRVSERGASVCAHLAGEKSSNESPRELRELPRPEGESWPTSKGPTALVSGCSKPRRMMVSVSAAREAGVGGAREQQAAASKSGGSTECESAGGGAGGGRKARQRAE